MATCAPIRISLVYAPWRAFLTILLSGGASYKVEFDELRMRLAKASNNQYEITLDEIEALLAEIQEMGGKAADDIQELARVLTQAKEKCA